MNLTIFGANGPTGQILTHRALDEGLDVTAFTRHPDAFPALGGALRVVGGDVLDVDAVESAIAGQDAVVSTLGVPFGREPVTTYSIGVAHMLEAMGRQGVKRLVCVSSTSLSPHPEPQGGVLFRKVIQPYVVNVLGRTVYDDIRRMEHLLRQSQVDWTIVRPSGLFTNGEVSDYRVAEEAILGRFTAREDLADCLLRQVTDRTYVRRALAVATVAVQPNMVALVWREGIRKRS